MIAKPTTEQILLDCSRELREVVLPAVPEGPAQVTVMMLDLVLRNTAERAAHEIAWMTEEIEELNEFVRAAGTTGAATGDEAASGTDGRSLHLADVVERYRQASEAFSDAIEAAVAAGDRLLVDRGGSLLERRVDREAVLMCGWSPVGR
jgi:hypothetical protein